MLPQFFKICERSSLTFDFIQIISIFAILISFSQTADSLVQVTETQTDCVDQLAEETSDLTAKILNEFPDSGKSTFHAGNNSTGFSGIAIASGIEGFAARQAQTESTLQLAIRVEQTHEGTVSTVLLHVIVLTFQHSKLSQNHLSLLICGFRLFLSGLNVSSGLSGLFLLFDDFLRSTDFHFHINLGIFHESFHARNKRIFRHRL